MERKIERETKTQTQRDTQEDTERERKREILIQKYYTYKYVLQNSCMFA